MKHAIVLLALVLSLAGCSESLDPASRLASSRVLGAYFVHDDDPTRANPYPGESGVLELFLADPGAPRPRSYVMIACLPAPVSFGTPFCRAAPFAAVQVEADPGDPVVPPALPLTAPSEAELGETTALLVLGAVCTGSPVNPELLALLSGTGEPPEVLEVCEDPEADGTLFNYFVNVEQGDPPNTHPTIASIELDGAPFDAVSPADAAMLGCAGDPAYPEVRADGEEHHLTLRVPASAREDYETIDPDTEEPVVVREELQVGRFATAGDVKGTFGWIDGDLLENVLRWEAPEKADPAGELVRFVFTLRDGRGGFAHARREFCLVP